MVLVSCSECEGKVSDRASACPHCGCPVGEVMPELKSDSSLGEDEKHSWDDRVLVYFTRRDSALFLWLCAAFCFLFPASRAWVSNPYSSARPVHGSSNGHGTFITEVDWLHFSVFFWESLAIWLLAFFVYKNTYAFKKFVLLYLAAFVVLFPPSGDRQGSRQPILDEFNQFEFIGNVQTFHAAIWFIEMFFVGIGFYLLFRQKNR